MISDPFPALRAIRSAWREAARWGPPNAWEVAAAAAGALGWCVGECADRDLWPLVEEMAAEVWAGRAEAARETDPEKRVAELVQVAAVALSWAQAIEESSTAPPTPAAPRADAP